MAFPALAFLGPTIVLVVGTVIDAPTSAVIVAIVGAIATLAVRLIPKTRPEAAADRASARIKDAEAWNLMVKNLRSDNQDLRTENAGLEARLIASEAKSLQAEESLKALRADYEKLLAEMRRNAT